MWRTYYELFETGKSADIIFLKENFPVLRPNSGWYRDFSLTFNIDAITTMRKTFPEVAEDTKIYELSSRYKRTYPNFPENFEYDRYLKFLRENFPEVEPGSRVFDYAITERDCNAIVYLKETYPHLQPNIEQARAKECRFADSRYSRVVSCGKIICANEELVSTLNREYPDVKIPNEWIASLVLDGKMELVKKILNEQY